MTKERQSVAVSLLLKGVIEFKSSAVQNVQVEAEMNNWSLESPS